MSSLDEQNKLFQKDKDLHFPSYIYDELFSLSIFVAQILLAIYLKKAPTKVNQMGIREMDLNQYILPNSLTVCFYFYPLILV